jgi:hypothetical protein
MKKILLIGLLGLVVNYEANAMLASARTLYSRIAPSLTRSLQTEIPKVILTSTEARVLQVPSGNYSAKELKAAFLKQAKIMHPDAGGSHDGFLHLKNTYDTVLNRFQNQDPFAHTPHSTTQDTDEEIQSLIRKGLYEKAAAFCKELGMEEKYRLYMMKEAEELIKEKYYDKAASIYKELGIRKKYRQYMIKEAEELIKERYYDKAAEIYKELGMEDAYREYKLKNKEQWTALAISAIALVTSVIRVISDTFAK